jgi:4-hydroxy-tetrahydrodipicolinate reductase
MQASPTAAPSAAIHASPADPLRIAIAGATGRMGRMLIEAVLDAPDCELAGALDVTGNPQLGQDAGAFLGRTTGIATTDDLDGVLAASQVLIDFTRPEGTLRHLAACAERGVALVIGTTGFSAEQKAAIGAAARRTAVFLAPNMSVGVNVVMRLLEQAAKSLSHGYDIEIIEAHHRNKIDAPSGTALAMGEVVAKALGRNLADNAVFGREGVTGARDPSTIGFATVRGGDIIGDHTVLFAGIGERIEITHKSSSRAAYAQGSLRAARFLAHSGPGLYDMNDVLGLN